MQVKPSECICFWPFHLHINKTERKVYKWIYTYRNEWKITYWRYCSASLPRKVRRSRYSASWKPKQQTSKTPLKRATVAIPLLLLSWESDCPRTPLSVGLLYICYKRQLRTRMIRRKLLSIAHHTGRKKAWVCFLTNEISEFTYRFETSSKSDGFRGNHVISPWGLSREADTATFLKTWKTHRESNQKKKTDVGRNGNILDFFDHIYDSFIGLNLEQQR